MENPDWYQMLKECGLPAKHVARVGDAVYELLLQGADDLTRRFPGKGSRTREAVQYLDKAIAFHAPSRGYYWLMANCAFTTGEREKEAQLRRKALETPPHDAAELFYINRDRRWGTVSKYQGYPEYTFEQNYRDHREMLQFDPTYYNALFFMAMSFDKEKRHAEELVAWYGCTAMKPDDYVALCNRADPRSARPLQRGNR